MSAVKITLDIETLLPGADWQRLETWAGLAGMTPAEYVRACARRGHLELKGDLATAALFLRPNADAPVSGAAKS